MSLITKIKRALRIGSRINNSTSGSITYIDSNHKLAEDNANLNYDDSGKVFKIGGSLTGATANTAILRNTVASATTANLHPNSSDLDTGVGSAGNDQLSLIAGNKEGQRITETTVGNESLQHNINAQLGQATGDEAAYSFSYTINKDTSGNDTGILIVATDTNSPGVSNLIVAKVDSSEKFTLDVSGAGTFYGFCKAPGLRTLLDDQTFRLQERNFSSADNAIEVMNNSTFTNTTGQSAILAILPTYNQASGDGANTDLLINRTETAIGSGNQNLIEAQIGGTPYFAIRKTSTSGDTYLMIYDVDNGTMERVSVGAADSGGSGYKVLRIPN